MGTPATSGDRILGQTRYHDAVGVRLRPALGLGTVARAIAAGVVVLACNAVTGVLDLDVADGALFPQRELKTPAEAAAIREGNDCSAASGCPTNASTSAR